MKKQLVIIGMTLLLFAVGLSGCTDNKNVSSWTGTWDTDWNFYGDVALKTELTLNQKADGSVTEPTPIIPLQVQSKEPLMDTFLLEYLPKRDLTILLNSQ